MDTRKRYPTDVSDEEWSFVAPYLTLIDEQAPQRHHDLVRDYERLPQTLTGIHFIVFAILMLLHAFQYLGSA